MSADTLPRVEVVTASERHTVDRLLSVTRIHCHDCGKPLGVDETVYRPLWGGWEGTYCSACFEADSQRTDNRLMRARLSVGFSVPQPCACCGRPFVVARDVARRCCSHACDQRLKRERRRAARCCAYCGLSFNPTRSDTRYCCAGCKQADYRKRLKPAAPITPRCEATR
jgi:hypothetical protein